MENIKNEIITDDIDVRDYIANYIKELKYKDIVVETFEEALKLVEGYKKSGKYNWFRGQTGLWPLISSVNRLNNEERNEAEEKLKRFDNWAYANNLFKDFDSSEAIAQHHGLKTMFLDFTINPKVAAYFASDNINYEGYEYSCIYCLNSEEFEESINEIKKYYPNIPYPRLLDIDVHNLWRLQSQEGKFMYQPIINLDFFYSLSRIVFRVKENDIKLFDKSYIYPIAKSVLEERLDGFFLNEKTSKNIENTYNFIDALKKTGMNFEIVKISNELYIKEFVNEEELLKHKWDEENLKLWENKTIEKFGEVYTTQKVIFTIDSFKNIELNKQIVYEKLNSLLNNDRNIRKKTISFSIDNKEENVVLIQKFENFSNIIWNGMRKLPYENEEIAKVISCLMLVIDISIFEYRRFDKKFLEIGINDGCGGFNKAFVNENSLLESMRSDLNKCVVKDINDVRSIIYHIRSPQLLYKFESLKKLFVESIIISQVVYGGNDFTIFSPVELELLGSP